MKTTERRRLKDAGLVAVEGWLVKEFAAIVNDAITATRPEVERILALPPIDRRSLPREPWQGKRGRKPKPRD